MSEEDIVVGEQLQTGLTALAEHHGQAELIVEDGEQPYVFVDIGTFDLEGYDYDQTEARVILRIHKDFPRGRNYGMVTIPVLTVGDRNPDNTTRNHQHAECLREAGIDSDYLYWSRDWQELTVTEADDMAKAVAFVHGTLGNPFQNE